MQVRFQNRCEAGRLLALRLRPYHERSQTVVLGLPRGGVPVAYEIARSLNLPLSVCLVGKLGLPSYPELAMGAISSTGVRIINYSVINAYQIAASTIDEVTRRKQQELNQKYQLYCQDMPPLSVEGQTIILVDDGIATGSTILAAIQCLRPQRPQSIVIAVPVIQSAILRMLETVVEKIVAICVTDNLQSISLWYEDFAQVSHEHVRYCLQQHTSSMKIEAEAPDH